MHKWIGVGRTDGDVVALPVDRTCATNCIELQTMLTQVCVIGRESGNDAAARAMAQRRDPDRRRPRSAA